MKSWAVSEPTPGMVCSLSTEEAAILFQRGGLFRDSADQAPWRDSLRFQVGGAETGGFLAFVPRAALRDLLSAPARHALEVRFQQRVFDVARPSDWPEFAPLVPPAVPLCTNQVLLAL